MTSLVFRVVVAIVFLPAVLLHPTALQAQCENLIGLYTVTEPTGSLSESTIKPVGGAGGFPMYIMLTNPVDQNTDLPILVIGGYELSVRLPDGWSIIPSLPDGVGDGTEDPGNFLCSGFIPVTGRHTVLAEVMIGSWGGGDYGGIYFEQLDGPQSIPGHMAIYNAYFENAPVPALPSSGSHDEPVGGITWDRGPIKSFNECLGLPAGHGELDWTGDDNHGRAVARGTYFARMKIAGRSGGDVLKMCLMR